MFPSCFLFLFLCFILIKRFYAIVLVLVFTIVCVLLFFCFNFFVSVFFYFYLSSFTLFPFLLNLLYLIFSSYLWPPLILFSISFSAVILFSIEVRFLFFMWLISVLCQLRSSLRLWSNTWFMIYWCYTDYWFCFIYFA